MDKEVKIGEIAISNNAGILTASGVGSCLVISLYDPKLKMGAMAHVMLPSNASRDTLHASRFTKSASLSAVAPLGAKVERDTKYVDDAIEEMLRKMESRGAKRGDLEAKLVGGANMFSSFASDIGGQNVASAKENLKKAGVKVVGESVGGSQGRSVEFAVSSGIVTVKIKF